MHSLSQSLSTFCSYAVALYLRYLPGEESLLYNVAGVSQGEVLELTNYPNPAPRGPVTVDAMVSQAQDVSIGLYDEANSLRIPVYTGQLPANSRQSFPLNLEQLPAGTYYLRLSGSGSYLTRRVVVQ